MQIKEIFSCKLYILAHSFFFYLVVLEEVDINMEVLLRSIVPGQLRHYLLQWYDNTKCYIAVHLDDYFRTHIIDR